MVYLQSFKRWAGRCLCASLFISLTQAAQAQTGTEIDPDAGSAGRNTIQGTVHYPGGRRLDFRAKVTLHGVNPPERFTFTDDGGAFSFAGLRGGSYTVTAEAGKDYESASESVNLLETEGTHGSGAVGRTVHVRIELQTRQAAPQATGTVTAVPDEVLALYKQAVTAAANGDRKQAIELLERAVALCPAFWTAWNEMGVQRLRRAEFVKALEALRTAAKIEPQAFEPRLNSGIALLQMKEYAQAAGELQLAIARKNNSAAAHLHMGHALIGLNRFAEAERQLNEALKLGGDAVIEAHRWLAAVYIEQHKEPRAAEELEKYLTLLPTAHDAGRIRDIIRQLRNPLAKN
ncbi:MAG TPA: tetratricopeptide repeat protein [Blastocatellia bacterium]|nr:tetratricopeptide repeat protein [Blastocatellia bacterium]